LGHEEFSDYRYVGGRRFNNIESSHYLMPTDKDEHNRLQLQHQLCRYVWQSNFNSPMKEALSAGGKCVLDIGTGSGAWMLDNASEYKDSSFVGIDISPPDNEQTPPNAVFLKHNILTGFPFEAKSFDFVFQRFVAHCLTIDQIQHVLNEMARITKPGGYVELMEVDTNFLDRGPETVRLQEIYTEKSLARGIDISILPKLDQILKESGYFSEVHADYRITPVGSWGGKIGELFAEDFFSAMEYAKPVSAIFFGLTHEQIDAIRESMMTEVNVYHTRHITYRFWAKRI